MKYIFARNYEGCYVVTLGSEIGFSTHCVAIDCDRRLIYDCMENYVLLLNRKNLDYCLGSYSNGVKCIPQCFYIQEQHRKKSSTVGMEMNKKRKSNEI